MEVELKKEDDPYRKLFIPEGGEIKVGQKIYRNPQTVLIEGAEVEMSERAWGKHQLSDGRYIEIEDGVIIDISQPIEVQAQLRRKEYRSKN